MVVSDDQRTGKLSVEAAAKFLLNSKTREYRRSCLAFWRELHGDAYADAVEAEVRAKWGKG